MKELDKLLTGIEIKSILGDKNRKIKGFNYDSRKCKENFLFVAIRGVQFDGHNFIKKAIENGANTIVCEDKSFISANSDDLTFIIVDNSRLALSKISANWFDNPSKKMKVVGVTGTNGKTTITFLIKQLLEANNYKVGIIGTTGIFVGEKKIPATHTTPESLELQGHLKIMNDSNVDFVVMEVSSHSLIQSRVADIDFDFAIFTNLTHEHLDFHKTMEEYALAKKLLFDSMDKGVGIVNSDDNYADLMLKDFKGQTKLKIGRANTADIQIEDEQFNNINTSFTLNFKNDNNKIKFDTQLAGRFNIDNVSFAIVIAKLLKLDNDLITNTVRNIEGAIGRMQKIELSNGALGIVDYSHTPDALEKALKTCRELLHEDSNLLCVFGCGGDRDKEKRPLMGAIAGRLADYIILTDDNPRTENHEKIIDMIYQGTKKGDKQNTVIISKRDEAIKYAVNLSHKNDIILVAGKGHEDYQIIGTKKKFFSDINELKKYIKINQ